METMTQELQHEITEHTPPQAAQHFEDPVLALEHYHRYLYASRFVGNKRVLDVACGEGYGAAFLSQHAAEVIGIDSDEQRIAEASRRYNDFSRARFVVGRCEELTIPEKSIDVAVCFETIEHLSFEVQHTFMERLKRSIAAGGLAIVSCPEKDAYREVREAREENHQHEFSAVEFYQFLKQYFKSVIFVGQKPLTLSMIWSLHDWRDDRFKLHAREDFFTAPNAIEQFTEPLHLIAVCSDSPLSRDIADGSHSIYVDVAHAKRLRGSSASGEKRLKSENEQLQNDIVRMRGEYNQNTELVQRLYSENLNLKTKGSELATAIDQRDKSLHRLEGVVAEKNELIERLHRERGTIAAQADPLKEENQSLNAWVRQLQSDLDAQVLRASNATEQNEQHLARIADLQKEIGRLATALNDISADREQLEGNSSQIQQALREKEALTQSAEQTIASLRQEIGNLRKVADDKSESLVDALKKLEAQMSMIHRLQREVEERSVASAAFESERTEFRERLSELERKLEEQSQFAKMSLDETDAERSKSAELQKHLDQQANLSRNMFRENEELRTRIVELQKSGGSPNAIVADLANERDALVAQVRSMQQEAERHGEELRSLEQGFAERIAQGEDFARQCEEHKSTIQLMKTEMEEKILSFETYQKSQSDLQQRYNKSQIKVQELQTHCSMLEQKFDKMDRSPVFKAFSVMGLFPKKEG